MSIGKSFPDRFAFEMNIGGYNLRSFLLFPIFLALEFGQWIGVLVLPFVALKSWFQIRKRNLQPD